MTQELQSHFLSLYSMALADTEFDEKEIAILYKIGEEKGIPKENVDTLLLNPSSSSKFHLPDTITEKVEYLYDYAKMILADGVVHDEELKTLQKFCIKFQFEEKNIQSISELLIEAAKNDIPKEDLLNFVIQNN